MLRNPGNGLDGALAERRQHRGWMDVDDALCSQLDFASGHAAGLILLRRVRDRAAGRAFLPLAIYP